MIFNVDETGFQIDITAGEKVIIPTEAQAAYFVDPENRGLVNLTSITVVEKCLLWSYSPAHIIYGDTSTMT